MKHSQGLSLTARSEAKCHELGSSWYCKCTLCFGPTTLEQLRLLALDQQFTTTCVRLLGRAPTSRHKHSLLYKGLESRPHSALATERQFSPHVAPPAAGPVSECGPACQWTEIGRHGDRRSEPTYQQCIIYCNMISKINYVMVKGAVVTCVNLNDCMMEQASAAKPLGEKQEEGFSKYHTCTCTLLALAPCLFSHCCDIHSCILAYISYM